jgi:hypothetical protein
MTTGATQVFPGAHVTAGERFAGCRTLSTQAQDVIERLTEDLFFDAHGLHRKSILMADFGSPRASSLWLATEVASVLGKSLNQEVRVVCVGSRSSDIVSAWKRISVNPGHAHCVLEHRGDVGLGVDSTKELSNRLSAIRAAHGCVVVHLAKIDRPIGIFARTITVDGVVLLVRAGKTHRAALGAIDRDLSPSGVPPLLGSILLDRVYPIPEKIYRLL